MRLVRDNPTETQVVSTLSDDRQVELETANVLASLKYAAQELGL